jgi:hypothetical protein
MRLRDIMPPAGWARRRASQGCPRLAMARPPGEPRGKQTQAQRDAAARHHAPCRLGEASCVSSGLPMPHRRTFATAILAFAHSVLTALRHPCLRLSATPAPGAWAAPNNSHPYSRSTPRARAGSPGKCQQPEVAKESSAQCRDFPYYSRFRSRLGLGGASFLFISSALAFGTLTPFPSGPFASFTPVWISVHL